jgi:hypothetical protein
VDVDHGFTQTRRDNALACRRGRYPARVPSAVMTPKTIIALDIRIREATNQLNEIKWDLREMQKQPARDWQAYGRRCRDEEWLEQYLHGLKDAFAIVTGHEWNADELDTTGLDELTAAIACELETKWFFVLMMDSAETEKIKEIRAASRRAARRIGAKVSTHVTPPDGDGKVQMGVVREDKPSPEREAEQAYRARNAIDKVWGSKADKAHPHE